MIYFVVRDLEQYSKQQNVHVKIMFALFHTFFYKENKKKCFSRGTCNTLITLSAFSFAAFNYQLSIVSTHFVQRQQTSAYGMISYTLIHLFSQFSLTPFLLVSFCSTICVPSATTQLSNANLHSAIIITWLINLQASPI